MHFRNRDDAARMLAEKLEPYRGQSPLVLAIPRGAMPMAAIISGALGGEMDVVLVRKMRAPANPELAIGSVDETGWTYLADYARQMADADYLEAEKNMQLAVMRERRAQYTPIRPPHDPARSVAERRGRHRAGAGTSG